jgi:hypothetical protein
LENKSSFPFFKTEEIQNTERLSGGRNNEAIRIETSEGLFLLKRYLNPKDRIRRFNREVTFLKYCKELGITCTPKLLGQSLEDFAILQEFIEGVRPKTITKQHFESAIKFIYDLNREKVVNQYGFSKAADFLDSGESIVDNLRTRIKGLDDSKIALVISAEKYKTFKDAFSKVQNPDEGPARSLNRLLEKMNRMPTRDFLSPSDFGFHNSIETQHGLFFIDFEYSGLDSPLKLILDFLFQPDFLIDESQAEIACDSMGEPYGLRFTEIPREVKLLFALKWFMLILKRVFENPPSRIESHVAEEYFATRVEPLI